MKYSQSNILNKNTAQFKYVVKTFLSSTIDAAIIISCCKQEVNSSGHVQICTNHVTLHIFNWDPLNVFTYLQEMH